MLSIICEGCGPSTKISYGLEQLSRICGRKGIKLHAEIKSADEILGKTPKELGREGYELQITSQGVNTLATVTAQEDQGFLYGCLELAEQIELYGIEALQSKRETALVPFRGAKCNLPWEPYQEGYSTDINQEVYWDLSVWERYLDHLARGRTNVLMLWSQHPYHLMVKVPKYPEACPFTDEEMEEKIRFWKSLFAMAKARGMDVYMLTWNIHIHEKFAKERGFPLYGYDHPVIRDYLREAVKELIAVYDDLTGFATNPGERMYNFKAGAFEDFILDVYFKALKEAKRQVPFLLRSNWLPPEATRTTVEKANYPGSVFIDWKFNTSHGLSTWKLNGRESNRFLNPLPDGYKMLWHIRNEEAYILQWGDPEYVRDHVTNNHDPNVSEGYFFGPERVIPFLEEVRLDQNASRIQTYDFDRRWYMYEMWGRMGYNPNTPISYWKKRLSQYYKLSDEGEGLYAALRAASRVPLEFNTFWAGSWDGTAYAEGNLGFNPAGDAWDGNRERRFISVTDFIFHKCLDPDYMTVPEYVIHVLGSEGKDPAFVQSVEGRVTPFDVAERMAQSQSDVNAYLKTVTDVTNQTLDGQLSLELELTWMLEDLTIWSGLAGYYANKIRASTCLYGYMYSGDPQYRKHAVDYLHRAKDEWESIVEFTRHRIARQGYDHFDVFHWERYLEDAHKDIELAAKMKPIKELVNEIHCYRLGSYSSDGWGASMDRKEAPELTLEAIEEINDSEQIDKYLSATYSILGREYQWQPVPELSPSMETLTSNRPVEMVHELSKRYDIRTDFESVYGVSGTAYFAAVVSADADEAVHYELRTMDFARVWINGKEVFQSPKAIWYTEGRRGGRFPASLREGKNLIVIKLEAARRPFPPTMEKDRQDPESWGFHLEKGFSGYHFHRHHIFPHTLKGLKR